MVKGRRVCSLDGADGDEGEMSRAMGRILLQALIPRARACGGAAKVRFQGMFARQAAEVSTQTKL
jgi:hypothetical protein